MANFFGQKVSFKMSFEEKVFKMTRQQSKRLENKLRKNFPAMNQSILENKLNPLINLRPISDFAHKIEEIRQLFFDDFKRDYERLVFEPKNAKDEEFLLFKLTTEYFPCQVSRHVRSYVQDFIFITACSAISKISNVY